MDFRQLSYITTIADEKSITKAAEKLYITRSALNYSLLNTEKALGFPLFNRISNRLIPTYAGEIFLENARKVLASCKEMDHSLLALSDATQQRLSIGITVGGGQAAFASMFPDYHQQYPLIRVNLLEGNMRILEEALLNGTIDIAFFGEIPDNPLITFREVLDPQPLLLAVPEDHFLISQYGLKSGDLVDLKLFESESFIIMNRKSFLNEKISDIFHESKIRPHIIMECSQMNMVLHFIEGKVGLGFVPGSLLKDHPHLMSFSVQPEVMIHQTILFRKNSFFSQPELDFIDGIIHHHSRSV
ncbi:MAG: LysR family transcriptional regulator [Clostridia bacterium]|nr:LysR family transcriptional regulator [Clostridia bacterium]